MYWTKPDESEMCFWKNVTHFRNLLRFLLLVFLVDTDGVNPNQNSVEGIPSDS